MSDDGAVLSGFQMAAKN
jgi:hypothetical protein